MQTSVIQIEAFINLRVIDDNFNTSRSRKLLRIRCGLKENFFLTWHLQRKETETLVRQEYLKELRVININL